MTNEAAEYGKIMGRKDWGEKMDELIPHHMHVGLMLWIKYGRRIEPGHFLTSILKNQLFEAFGRADDMNRLAMENWVRFFHNYAPSGARHWDHWKGVCCNKGDEK